MNLKTAAIVLIAFAALASVAAVLLFQDEGQPGGVQAQAAGTARAIEFGRAGDYGYLSVHYNGTGNLTLIALSEQPKRNIIVLNQDYLTTERYSYFMDLLRSLSSRGFTITEVDSIASPQNSIILIPSGAMPSEVLQRLDNLTATNEIVYVGKTDLVFTNRLESSQWLSNVSAQARPHIYVLEKTLDEFYLEKNYSLFSEIESNAWAEKASQTFRYSGAGDRTYFIPLNGAKWLRMLPLSDSEALPAERAEMSGNFELFAWQKSQATILMNYSNGTASYRLEKDRKVIQQSELDRVRGDQAFFLTLSFPESGDYILKVYDDAGMMAARRIHVKDVNVSFARAYGNAYEFSVLLDGAPLEEAPASVGLNHSSSSVDSEVKNGVLLVHANLQQGENVFVITLYGQKNYVKYDNAQESITAFYAKYLGIALLAIAVFYLAVRVNKKPVYRIRVPESASGKNPEIRLKSREIVSAMEEVEHRFGWENTPLYAKEIGIGLKRLSGGMEVNEGNVEAVLKTLEGKGLVKSYSGLYGLTGWGDPRQGAIKRIIRDKLVQNGVEFTEDVSGFFAEGKQIVLDADLARKEAIIVFEDKADVRAFLSGLDDRKRAIADLKIKNGMLRLATLDELDELI